MGMQFKPLTPEETKQLAEALRGNAEKGTPLHMDALTTGWRPGEDEIGTEEVVNAIKSIPSHY